MNQKLYKKLLAFVLVFGLLLPNFADLVVNAAPNSTTSEVNSENTEILDADIAKPIEAVSVTKLTRDSQILKHIDQTVLTANKHIARLAEEETLSSYAFLNSDGTKTVYYMDKEVKFLDKDGKTVEKDISLTNTLNGFTTVSNDIGLLLPNDPTNGISMSYNGYDIIIVPEGGSLRKAAQSNNSSVIYPDYFGSGMSLMYTPSLDGLKEDIVLSHYTGVTTFVFRLFTDGLRPYQENNRYYLALSEAAEMRIDMGDVVAFDARGRFSVGAMNVTTVAEGQEYLLTLSVDAEFLTDETTTYPVSIDPTLTVSDNTHGAGAIEDITIYSGTPNANCDWPYLHCGYYNSTYKVARTMFRLTGLLSSSEYQSVSATDITSAEFHIQEATGTAALPVHIYSNAGNAGWTETGATWKNSGHTLGTIYATVSPGVNQAVSYDITNLVKAWKNNTESAQAGFILVSSNETSLDKAFYSSETATTSYRSYVVVTYQLDAETISVRENETQTLSSAGISGTITWESSNTSVATVNSAGVVTGVKAGTTTITASVSGILQKTFHISVILQDGIYYLKNNLSAYYLSAQNSNVVSGTLLTQESKRTASPTRFSQLWKITYLGSERYSIRPMHKLDRGLHVAGTTVDIQELSTTDSLALIAQASRWSISYEANGYVIRQNGLADKTIAPSGLSSAAYTTMVLTSPTSLSDGHKWSLENVTSSVGNQIIFYDAISQELVTNATRYVAPEEFRTCADMGLYASFVSRYTNSQDISWSVNNAAAATVAVTGGVRGVTPLDFTTVRAAVTWNGTEYSRTYGLHVTAIPEGTYFLRNKGTGKYADVENHSASLGAQACQWGYNGADIQKWDLAHQGNGRYTIKPASATATLYMSVQGNSSVSGANIVLGTTTGAGALWSITETANSVYKLSAESGESNNMALSIADTAIDDGAPLQQRSYVSDLNYRDEWHFVQVGFHYVNYYDSTFVSDSTLLSNITLANTFVTNVFFNCFGVDMIQDGSPERYISIAESCSNTTGPCIPTTCPLGDEGHHKSVQALSNQLYNGEREDNHIYVLWANRPNGYYCSDTGMVHEVLLEEKVAVVVNHRPVINFLTIDNIANDELALMAITLAHETAHVFGLGEQYYDTEHQSQGDPCIMNDIGSVNPQTFYTDILRGDAAPFCDSCLGKLAPMLITVLNGNYGN